MSLWVLHMIVAAAALSASADPLPKLPEPHHGLSYSTPAGRWDEAIPLGNGMMGALVWKDGKPLRIALDRADLWDLRRVPEFFSAEYKFKTMKEWHEQGRVKDLLRVYEDPYQREDAPTKIPAGRIEFHMQGSFAGASLSLADAIGAVQFSDGGAAEVFVHATEAVGMMRIRNAASGSLRLLAPAFVDSGDIPRKRPSLASLGYPAPVLTEGRNWQGFSQAGSDGFRFAVYLEWAAEEGRQVVAWSIASSFEGPDPLQIARSRTRKALDRGYDQMQASHRAWWLAYWKRASVELPDPVLERLWFLDTYKFGAASRRGAPPTTLQAIWTADDGRIPPWKGDYHHDLNTQLSYWPCYSGNRLEEGLSFLDWLWDTRRTAFAWTRRFYGLPGLNVPMTADLKGEQMGGWRQYTHSASTAAWLAQHFYLHWRYSADRDFLRARVYPYIRDAAVFIEAFTAQFDENGKRTHPLSSSPEINRNHPEAWFPSYTNYDLALARWLMTAAAEVAGELGRTKEVLRWHKVLSELPELHLGQDGRLLVAKNYPLSESHRHFSHLMAIHPLGLIDWDDGPDAQRVIKAALAELKELGTSEWTGYSFAWYASLLARAREGEAAAEALSIYATAFVTRNSFHANGDLSGKGYSRRFKQAIFTLEGNMAAAAGLQEMLIQSHSGRIRVFPAIPPSWKDAAFTNLRAMGAFLVSARLVNGRVERVKILSERGGRCRIVSPFDGREVEFEMRPGEQRILEPPGAGN